MNHWAANCKILKTVVVVVVVVVVDSSPTCCSCWCSCSCCSSGLAVNRWTGHCNALILKQHISLTLQSLICSIMQRYQ